MAAALVAAVGLGCLGCAAGGPRTPTARPQVPPAPTASPVAAPQPEGPDGPTRSAAGRAAPGAGAPGPAPNGPATSATGRSSRAAPGGGRQPPRPGAGPAAPRPPADATTGTGPVVVLDPGHNGGNAARPSTVDQLVPAGFGRTKPCNTVGAATAAGYPEHAFTFDVAVRARRLLAARGVTVLLTRPDDKGVGPCVDRRGRFGNPVRAAAVVSIHADGAPPTGSGFHVAEAARAPAGPGVAAASHRLALGVRAAMLARSGFGYADYLGGDGLDRRDDLAGLNLSMRPTVLVECGNMANPADAARLASPAGRQRIAQAIAAGITEFLRRR